MKEIGECFNRYLQDVFTSSNLVFPKGLEGHIPNFISDEDNANLCLILDDKEIKEVLFRMGSFKALAPNGMSVIFYKHYWHIIKAEEHRRDPIANYSR
ncbi:hypothetical protein L1049_027636 [Liquidambar formosana]|uniref:Uncharacterized protein n=1 Tax=Liquidambar formosana TaxID=63359 RepID=A0AAP0WVM6_LIQFO